MGICAIQADLELQAKLVAHATRTKLLEPGELIFREGEAGKGIFLITSGSVELCLESSWCRSIRRVATAGCVLGLPSTLSGEPYSLSAEVIEPVTVVQLNKDDFDELMKGDTTCGLKLLWLLSAEVRALRTEIATGNRKPRQRRYTTRGLGIGRQP
jgi:CRP-like cAMP-binding protein